MKSTGLFNGLILLTIFRGFESVPDAALSPTSNDTDCNSCN